MKIGALALMAVLAVGSNVQAADPLPTEIALARRLFAEARVAEEAKDWQTAAGKLRDAIAIKETAGLRFHLAYCQEQMGMLVEALVDYERSDDLPRGANDDFRAQLPAKRESLHRRIPTVHLILPPEARNVSLSVDGHPLPASFLGKPVQLNPGHHVFVVTSPDFQRFTTEVALKEADAVVTNAVLVPLPTAPAVVPVPTAVVGRPAATPVQAGQSTSSTARTVVLIGEATVLAAGLAVGIGATLARMTKDVQREAQVNAIGIGGCRMPAGAAVEQCGQLERTIDSQRTYGVVSQLGFIGAGVGLLGFATTLLLWPPSRQTAAHVASVSPWAGPGLGGISISGQF